jgi:hypothetical protein
MPTNLLINKTLEATSSLRGPVSVSDFQIHERVDVFPSFTEIFPFRNESVPNVTSGGPPQVRGSKVTNA